MNVQLGHPVGEQCSRPRPVPKGEFVVVHDNGVHVVSLTFCGCETAGTYFRQLLRVRWFPATSDKPRTAATFCVLEHFHILSLESKISCYDFYNALSRLSDNTGLNPPKVRLSPTFPLFVLSRLQTRYEQFLRMVRQWRHLKMLKRSGRGHDPAGVLNSKEGECAVLCPACPQPGKNMSVSSSVPR